MKNFLILVSLLLVSFFPKAQPMKMEDYYIIAYNQISDMLDGKDSLSIKRAVYLSEWAYYEGKLDYNKDFCDEIERIAKYVNLFYEVNNLKVYKTGKQMSLNEYFFKPYSGNHFKPYIYDFEDLMLDSDDWEVQFVSKVLKSHIGQCRSLPWMYKILADEVGAKVSIAHAPRHTYIMYKDDDNFIPENWINLELTTHQILPAFWIKQDFEICDSAIIVGTYMNPLSDRETVASQLADLAMGYKHKFKRYDEFAFICANKSLEFYRMNPAALAVKGKSIEYLINKYLSINNYVQDSYVYFSHQAYEANNRSI